MFDISHNHVFNLQSLKIPLHVIRCNKKKYCKNILNVINCKKIFTTQKEFFVNVKNVQDFQNKTFSSKFSLIIEKKLGKTKFSFAK